MENYASHAWAQNSNKVINTATKTYLLFILALAMEDKQKARKVLTEGCDNRTLMRYIALLARTLKVTTIITYISMGVRLYHVQNNLHWTPIRERFPVAMLIRGIRRIKGDGEKAKQPITLHILRKIRKHIDLRTKWGKCIWAALLLAFYCMLRKSSISADKQDTTNDRALIRTAHLFIREGRLWIRLFHTKTIQFGERVLELPVPQVPGSDLCATTAIMEHIKANAPDRNGPLFKVGKQVLTYKKLLKELKSLLHKAGENPDDYAGHSLRRGGATWAIENAMLPAEIIRTIGDWKSQAYLRYLTISESLRKRAADMMETAIRGGRWGSANPLSTGGRSGDIDLWA